MTERPMPDTANTNEASVPQLTIAPTSGTSNPAASRSRRRHTATTHRWRQLAAGVRRPLQLVPHLLANGVEAEAIASLVEVVAASMLAAGERHVSRRNRKVGEPPPSPVPVTALP